jgi:hypothetical protein
LLYQKLRHEYKTIILPQLEEQQYDNTTPVVIPQKAQFNSLTELWYARRKGYEEREGEEI